MEIFPISQRGRLTEKHTKTILGKCTAKRNFPKLQTYFHAWSEWRKVSRSWEIINKKRLLSLSPKSPSLQSVRPLSPLRWIYFMQWKRLKLTFSISLPSSSMPSNEIDTNETFYRLKSKLKTLFNSCTMSNRDARHRSAVQPKIPLTMTRTEFFLVE